MKIGILDIDGHNFPNLALMKISSYHKSCGNTVEWVNHFEHYDFVYKSKIFTFTPHDYFHIDADSIFVGGTGYDYRITLDPNIEHIEPDYSIYPKFTAAYGFLTRGCPNKCSWCVVPNKEGQIKPYSDIEEFLCGRKSAILMDNNVLSHEWGLQQIEKIIRLGIKVDFNQGLDARLINDDIAQLLSKVKWLKPLRMACDTVVQMPYIENATKLLRKYGTTPSNYFVYVLVKDIPDALTRVNFLRDLGLDPFAQPYIDFSGKNKVTKEQKQFARWVNHKAIFKSVKYENYR
jgi:hypothetical protein